MTSTEQSSINYLIVRPAATAFKVHALDSIERCFTLELAAVSGLSLASFSMRARSRTHCEYGAPTSSYSSLRDTIPMTISLLAWQFSCMSLCPASAHLSPRAFLIVHGRLPLHAKGPREGDFQGSDPGQSVTKGSPAR